MPAGHGDDVADGEPPTVQFDGREFDGGGVLERFHQVAENATGRNGSQVIDRDGSGAEIARLPLSAPGVLTSLWQ